ncbi:MAG: GNAT family N-acetyltransferase [bacterium]|nr:GNAT family N-acetyltransferase [bacterium]
MTMLKFENVTSDNIALLDRDFLKAGQAGTADEPRETVEVAKNFERATPILIYDGSEPIAFLVYEVLKADATTFFIWDFVVHHESQGKGYGYAIMRQLIDYLKSNNGATRIELAIVPDNMPARKLYLKVGFRENGKTNSDGELEMEMAL